MSPAQVLEISRHALTLLILLAAPLLLAALAVGLIVGMLQAATQVNELTLSFIPKLLAMALVLMIAGPWMLHILVDYTRQLIVNLPALMR